MRVAKQLGVNIKANLMIGFPDETRRDLLETLAFGLQAAWIGVDDIPLFPFSPYPGTALYEQLREDGTLPPPDDDYFAGLGYMDIMRTTSVCQHIGTVELNMYRILGMAVFYAISYARRPSRIVRTVRNVLAGRSETVLEQRLTEFKPRTAQRPVVNDGRAAGVGRFRPSISSTDQRAGEAVSLVSAAPSFELSTHASRRSV
jgi:hypothetical protein